MIKFLFWRTLSNFLILVAIFGIVGTFGPSIYYQIVFKVGELRGIKYVLAPQIANTQEGPTELGKLVDKYWGTNTPQSQRPSLLGDVLSKNQEKILIPPNTEFSIVIPKIGASEAITANVDANNKDEYLKILQHSIAHAKGTAYPGIDGTTYLFAHSADNFWDIGRYNAVFYLLKDMKPGDDIYVFFQGKRYNYVVYDTKIVDSTDVEYIDSSLGQGERLILQTCWPPGTDWKRSLVFARPKAI